MLRLDRVVGHRSDPWLAAPLHALEHAGGIEVLHVPEADLARRRLRAVTDRGTDCAVALDRDARLADGAVLLLTAERAILVRAGAPDILRLRPLDASAALRLGHLAGHLHWRVRFEDPVLAVLLDGPRDAALARLGPLADAVEVLDGP